MSVRQNEDWAERVPCGCGRLADGRWVYCKQHVAHVLRSIFRTMLEEVQP